MSSVQGFYTYLLQASYKVILLHVSAFGRVEIHYRYKIFVVSMAIIRSRNATYILNT